MGSVLRILRRECQEAEVGMGSAGWWRTRPDGGGAAMGEARSQLPFASHSLGYQLQKRLVGNVLNREPGPNWKSASAVGALSSQRPAVQLGMEETITRVLAPPRLPASLRASSGSGGGGGCAAAAAGVAARQGLPGGRTPRQPRAPGRAARRGGRRTEDTERWAAGLLGQRGAAWEPR